MRKKTIKKSAPLLGYAAYVDATDEEMEGIYTLFNEQEYTHINDILNGAVGMEEN